MQTKVSTPLLAIPALIALSCGGREPLPEWSRPNVLLLVVDCLRADRLGAVEPYMRPATPNLDALVDESISFTHAFSNTNWTRPSIPSFLTGLYPSEHGLDHLAQAAGDVSPSLATEALTLAEAFEGAGYARAMIGEQHQLAPRFGLGQGFEHYNHKGSKAESIHFGALDWLSQSERPFFLYLHYLELHWPYCPPESTRGQFTPGYEGRNFCYRWRELRNELRSGAVVLDDVELDAMIARYDEELLALDARLGELFAELRERDLWDETLIVVTSDHGEEFFEHGGMGHGTTLFDELIAVPLVMKPPASWGAPVGTKVDALVELRDLAPTLLEAARAETLVPGTSQLPFLFGRRPEEIRGHVTTEFSESIAVRTRDLKLVAHRSDGRMELYDLVADPGELADVAAQRPRDVARLRGLLRDWRNGLEPIGRAATQLDAETREGLRSLGYLD